MTGFNPGENVWGRGGEGIIWPITINGYRDEGHRRVYQAEINFGAPTGTLFDFSEWDVARYKTYFG